PDVVLEADRDHAVIVAVDRRVADRERVVDRGVPLVAVPVERLVQQRLQICRVLDREKCTGHQRENVSRRGQRLLGEVRGAALDRLAAAGRAAGAAGRAARGGGGARRRGG